MSCAKKVTIIINDYFNAFYEDGTLSLSGKPEDLNAETLARTHPGAEFYELGEDVYGELLNGNDYPHSLEDVPLERLRRLS